MLNNVLTVGNNIGGLLEGMIADVPDEQLAVQFPGLPNHPAWVLGHLTGVYAFFSKNFGRPLDPPLPESFAQCTRGTSPCSTRETYPSKSELLSNFRRSRENAIVAARGIAPEAMSQPNPVEGLRGAAPTVGDLVVLAFCMHPSLHAGQVSDWRRAKGLPRMMG
jgi:hypothetical protein